MSTQVCFTFTSIDDVIAALDYLHTEAVEMNEDDPDDEVTTTVMNAIADALHTVTTTEINDEVVFFI